MPDRIEGIRDCYHRVELQFHLEGPNSPIQCPAVRRALNTVALTLTGLFATATAWAQATATWTGLAGPITGNTYAFETAANWSGNVAPANGDNLVFGALPSININLTNGFTAGNITFSGIQNGLYLGGAATLALNGNVTTTAGSEYWGFFGLPVALSAGNHVYTTGGNASIYHFGAISGTGGITKDGSNGLYLTASSTYNGGTILNAGTIGVGADYALGFGTVTLNGGNLSTAYAGDDIRLGNNFLLGANVNISTVPFFSDEVPVSLELGNGDGSTIKAVTGVTTVNFNLAGPQVLLLSGDIQDGSAATTYTFANQATESAYHLTGFNNYTGGTLIKSGGVVLFASSGSIPASGLITTEADGYAGLAVAGAQTAFLSRLNTATFAGTIGFDNENVFAGNIDLTSFAESESLTIGTQTTATLTGLITPASGTGGGFNFRNSGTLTLSGSNPLTGTTGLTSRSFAGDAMGLVVLSHSAPNTYSGVTIADGGGIIFASPGSLAASTTLHLFNGGYVSFTGASGYTMASLVSRVSNQAGSAGVLGIDSFGGTYTDPVDFSSLPGPVYLGTTSSGTTIAGTITTTNANSDSYYLTGINGASLQVNTQLTGAKVVHLGRPDDTQAYNQGSDVYLTNAANNYTGGTTLHSGWLTVYDPLALGTGALTVDASASGGKAGLETTGINLPTNISLQSSSTLDIYAGGNLTLSGLVSGSGGLSTTFGSTLTITGNNTYTGGNAFFATPVTATTNTALGSGSLALTEGARVTFTSAAPSIGSLLEGSTFDNGDGTVISASLVIAPSSAATLTINQSVDSYFDGAIVQGAGVGSLTKTGSGTLTISGYIGEDNAYTTPYSGGTSIVAGTLIAGDDTALGTGTITLNGGNLQVSPGVTLGAPVAFGANGGTLSGNTTFTSAITVGANAKLSPGDSPGTMTFSAGLTLAASGQLNFEVQSAAGVAGTGYDLISVSTGLLDITATSGSPFTIKLISLNASGSAGNVSDFSSANSYSWMLFQGNTGSGISGFDPTKFSVDTSSFTNSFGTGTFSLLQGVNLGNPAIFLNFAPVPEPSTYALLALGLAGIALKTRRRRG